MQDGSYITIMIMTEKYKSKNHSGSGTANAGGDMESRITISVRRLAIFLIAALLLSGCGVSSTSTPTAVASTTEMPTAPQPSPSPYQGGIVLATSDVSPGDVLGNAPSYEATQLPQPKPTATDIPSPTPTPKPGLSLTTGSPPEDVKDILQESPSFIVITVFGKMLPPGDPQCANAELLDYDVLMFESLKWPPGEKVKVSVALPAGKTESYLIPVSEKGTVRMAYQPGTGPHGIYVVMLENGQDVRKCTFQYVPRTTPGVFLISSNSFEPVYDREKPGMTLILTGFAPFETARLLAYRATERKYEWALLGWQKLKLDSSGQFVLELGPDAGNLNYVVIGEKSGEVHLWLPDVHTGVQREMLAGVKVLKPTPTPTRTPIK